MKKEIAFDSDFGRVIKEELVSTKYSSKLQKEIEYKKIVYKARRNDGYAMIFSSLKKAKEFVVAEIYKENI